MARCSSCGKYIESSEWHFDLGEGRIFCHECWGCSTCGLKEPNMPGVRVLPRHLFSSKLVCSNCWNRMKKERWVGKTKDGLSIHCTMESIASTIPDQTERYLCRLTVHRIESASGESIGKLAEAVLIQMGIKVTDQSKTPPQADLCFELTSSIEAFKQSFLQAISTWEIRNSSGIAEPKSGSSVRIIYTKDGAMLRLLVTTGQGQEFIDFVGEGSKSFGHFVKGRHLLITGGPFDTGRLYDEVRRIGLEYYGHRPLALPPSEATHLCDFVWDDSVLTDSEEEFANVFAARLAECEVAPLGGPSGPKERLGQTETEEARIPATCGSCGRREEEAERFATCKHCGRPFCFGDIAPHETKCPSAKGKLENQSESGGFSTEQSRGNRETIESELRSDKEELRRLQSMKYSYQGTRIGELRNRIEFLKERLAEFDAAVAGVSPSPPSESPRETTGEPGQPDANASPPESPPGYAGPLCDICGGVATGKCPNCGRFFCDMHLPTRIHRPLLKSEDSGVTPLPEAERPRSPRKPGVGTKIVIALVIVMLLSIWAYAVYLNGSAGSIGNQSTSSSSRTSLEPTSTGTTSVFQSTSSSTTASGTRLSDPSFLGTEANITYPIDYAQLENFALGLINQDRAGAGLGPVSVSQVPSGQQHADSMTYFGYFSHWDPQGYKPYMRYTLLGGTGAVAENIGKTYCTNSSPDSTLLTVRPCNLTTIENGIAASEWGMINNDLQCCNNGHRDNILDPQHDRVSIGIAYDSKSSTIYFVEDFESLYTILNSPVVGSSNTVTIQGSLTESVSVSELTIYYDPLPSVMTTSQLDATFAYGPGSFVGGVFPPCSASCQYYPGGVNVYASEWQVSSTGVAIQFPLGKFEQADGAGVYTIYLQTGDNTGTAFMTYSVFFQG